MSKTQLQENRWEIKEKVERIMYEYHVASDIIGYDVLSEMRKKMPEEEYLRFRKILVDDIDFCLQMEIEDWYVSIWDYSTEEEYAKVIAEKWSDRFFTIRDLLNAVEEIEDDLYQAGYQIENIEDLYVELEHIQDLILSVEDLLPSLSED